MKYIFSALLLITFYVTQAQSPSDALRFSQYEDLGTARTLGIGGAIGALGADYSSLSINPAGLAWYRRSELVFTPSTTFNNTTSTLSGNDPISSRKSKFSFNNAGFIAASRPINGPWKTINFGLGYNKLADYHQRFEYNGTTAGSITDRFLELAIDPNNIDADLHADDLDDFEAGVAYEAGAIYDKTALGDDEFRYVSDFQAGELVDKTQAVETIGSTNELVFALAGNYEERLMVGATIGIPFLNFEERKVYRETDENNFNEVFDELTYRENLITNGSGFNMKAGVQYRASQAIRLGIAAHSPTFLKMNDSYNTSMEYAYMVDGTPFRFESTSPDGVFNYRLRTPWKLIGSGAVIVGKMGFLSTEVEWTDYSLARFNFNNTFNSDDLAFERELNDSIRSNFQSTLKIKLGGEFAYKSIRLRGAYALSNSAYAEDEAMNTALSLGIGLRNENFYLDLGYRQAMTGETYLPYLTSGALSAPVSQVANDSNKKTYLMTFGFRF